MYYQNEIKLDISVTCGKHFQLIFSFIVKAETSYRLFYDFNKITVKCDNVNF